MREKSGKEGKKQKGNARRLVVKTVRGKVKTTPEWSLSETKKGRRSKGVEERSASVRRTRPE